MLRYLKSNVKVVQSLSPAVRTGTVESTAVQVSGYSSVLLVVSIGVLGGGAVAFKAQESANNTDWTDIDSGRLIGAFVAGVASTVQAVGISEVGGLLKNYIRVVATVTGGTGVGMAVDVVLGEPKTVPVGVSESVYIC